MARFAPALVALVVAACQPAAPTLDPSAEPIARQFFDEVRTGADLDASPHLAHELKNPTTEAEVAQFRSLIPEGPPNTVTLKTWDAKNESIGTTTHLTQSYAYADRTLTVRTALFKSPSGQDPVIVGFAVTSDAAS
jgi:hypothetical protein